MFNLNEKIMYVKGAVIDFKIWRRDRLIKKIKNQEDKLNTRNEQIGNLVENWLDGWSDVLNQDGYRTKDNNLIDLKEMIANQ